jgi:hypothetical protein
MLVYHTETGDILYTLQVLANRPPPSGTYIEVEDQDIEPSHWKVVDGALVAHDDLILSDTRTSAIETVNTLSGERRSPLITTSEGQDTVYAAKENEAQHWLAEAGQDVSFYPLIAAEIGITGDDADQVAQIFLNQAYITRVDLADLEKARQTTLNAIRAASTVEEINTALTSFKAG